MITLAPNDDVVLIDVDLPPDSASLPSSAFCTVTT